MKRYAAQWVYTLTSARPLKNAFVELADDGTILRTGVCEEGEPVLEGALCPGFVNAHCHVELSYMKGRFRKGTGMAGFIDQINALRDTSSPEIRVALLKEAMDGMYRQGVVAMADISNCDDSFAVKAAHPMYTRTFLEVFGAVPSECDAVMEEVKALQRKALSCGLDAAPTPHSCYTMSPELVTASSVEGLRSGFLSFHCEESEEEEEMMMYGRGPMWDNRIRNGIPTPPVTGTSSLQYFLDRLAAGLSYNRNGVVIGFFRDKNCTDQITVWDEDSGRFTVAYTDDGMTIAMTGAGLEEINSSREVYSPADSLQDGYSGCTMRITYACTLHSDDSLLCGDSHNDNTVELIWKCTSTEYYDRLGDDCHVYSYGIDLLKQFSDGLGDFENVKFKIRNDTEKYYVVAQLNEDGVYYVTGHADSRADATVFVPVDGHVIVRGMEDDAYTVTEIESDDGYSLLKDPIRIVISTEETGEYCPVCHRAFLTASATVNGESAEMTEDHAVLPFTVVNTPEFELPKTGSYGTWMYTAGGLAAACAGAALLLKGRKRGKDSE